MKFEIYDNDSPDGAMKTLWETERRTIYLKLANGNHFALSLATDGNGLKVSTTSGSPLQIFPQTSNSVVLKED